MDFKLLQEVVSAKREFFLAGNTKDINLRIKWVKLIRDNLVLYKNDFYDAFKADFNKPAYEVASTELGQVIKECDFLIKKGKELLKPERVKTGFINRKSKGIIYKEPYGVVLVVSPWNYPLNLSLIPAIGALFCGNCVLLKLSNNTMNVNKVIERVIGDLPKEAISTVYQDRREGNVLFDVKYDYIFFTGSKNSGKMVMSKASKYLTPITLELGGKSPVIVDADANIKLAAKRIVWGKFLNAGQTCIAPDYVLVKREIKKKFIKECIKWIKKFYIKKGQITNDFPFVINEKQVKRLISMIEEDKVLNKYFKFGRLISPILLDANYNDKIMQEEIFGPILPIIPFDSLDETIARLQRQDKPLALYYFGNDKDRAKKVIGNLSFGGGCINNTIMHFSVDEFPFGGVSASGLGHYHGVYTIETFTHRKSLLMQSRSELKVKFPPYTSFKRIITEFFLKIF